MVLVRTLADLDAAIALLFDGRDGEPRALTPADAVVPELSAAGADAG
jgi:hypothetical protein